MLPTLCLMNLATMLKMSWVAKSGGGGGDSSVMLPVALAPPRGVGSRWTASLVLSTPTSLLYGAARRGATNLIGSNTPDQGASQGWAQLLDRAHGDQY